MCLVQTKKKNSVPPFFVKHLALTLLPYSLPLHSPLQLTHTQRYTGSSRSAGYHTSKPSPVFCRDVCSVIFIYTVWRVFKSTQLQQADTEGGEREIGRESDMKVVSEEEEYSENQAEIG